MFYKEKTNKLTNKKPDVLSLCLSSDFSLLKHMAAILN